jgi:hypothetical protein
MAVDQTCSNCGREPSHPQVRHRFVYAAYIPPELPGTGGGRQYIAALCIPCYDADRDAGTGAARRRFLRQVGRWSALPAHRSTLVRLVEYPEGIGGEEWEAGTGFREGVAVRWDAVAVPGGTK